MRIGPNTEILVLSEEGTNLGRMSHRDALVLATERNLDLVNVNRADGIEVFKIMDHGKWKYDKKKHKQKKSHHQTKEMNFKLRIDPHDLAIKINRIKGFLEKGSDVKISVTLRGREKSNPRQAYDKLDDILKGLEGLVQIQQRKGSPTMAFAVVRALKTDGKKQKSRADSNDEGTKEIHGRSDIHGSDQRSDIHGNNGSNTLRSGNPGNPENIQTENQNKDSGTSASNERRVTV